MARLVSNRRYLKLYLYMMMFVFLWLNIVAVSEHNHPLFYGSTANQPLTISGYLNHLKTGGDDECIACELDSALSIYIFSLVLTVAITTIITAIFRIKPLILQKAAFDAVSSRAPPAS